MKTIISSDRTFQLWAYTVGHSQLLVRAVKAEDHPTRIDLMFEAVSAQLTYPVFRGLKVQQLGPSESNSNPFPGFEVDDGEFLYRLSSPSGQGFIVARSCDRHEDEKEYFDQDIWGMLPARV